MTYGELSPFVNITQTFYAPKLTRFSLGKQKKTKNKAVTPPPYEVSSVSVAAVSQENVLRREKNQMKTKNKDNSKQKSNHIERTEICDPNCDVNKCPRKLINTKNPLYKNKHTNKRKRNKVKTLDVSSDKPLKFEIKPKTKRNFLKRIRSSKITKIKCDRPECTYKKPQSAGKPNIKDQIFVDKNQSKNQSLFKANSPDKVINKANLKSSIFRKRIVTAEDSSKDNKNNCDDNNCDASISSCTTLRKIKEKICALHRKYSMVKEKYGKNEKGDAKTEKTKDKENSSKKLYASKKPENACEIKRCFKESVKLRKNDSYLSTGLRRICSIVKCSKNEKLKNDRLGETSTNLTKNRNDQTGEPVFEIKVDASRMCVLNKDDLKNNVTSFGNSANQKTCICPSHKNKKRNLEQKATCPTGLCKEAVKSKKTNFRCKCNPDTTPLCSDITCKKINGVSNYYNTKQNNSPLFDIELDSDRMCIINSADLEKNIGDVFHRKKAGFCNSGVCRSLANANKNYVCKCKQKDIVIEPDQCSKETCKSLDSKIDNRNFESKGYAKNENSDYYTRNKNSFDNLKNKMSCICSRITSRRNTRQFRKRRRPSGFYFRSGKKMKKNSSDPSYPYETKDVRNRTSPPLPNGIKPPCDCCICRKNSPVCEKLALTISRFRNFISASSFKKNTNLNEPNSLSMKNNFSNDKMKQWSFPFTSKTFSSLRDKRIRNDRRIQRGIGNKNNRDDKLMNKHVKTTAKQNKDLKINKNKNHRCMCHHVCECDSVKNKSKKKKGLVKKRKSKYIKKKKIKKRLKGHKTKEDIKLARERRKEFLKDEKKFQAETKKKEKADKKKREKAFLLEKKQLEAISKGKEELDETSCLADFFVGILKCVVGLIKNVGFIIFKLISNPKGSYIYVRQRLKDPIGTYERIKKTLEDAWRIKKLKIMKSLGGSDNMTILSDSIQNTALYQAFASKGKTKAEKRQIELKNKQRRMRIMQRDETAFRNCKHMLLHTLRKTPCLWFYHVCPYFYPQCLGLLSFIKKITDILLFMVAFMFWTPCIVCVEGCRAIFCCVLCTH